MQKIQYTVEYLQDSQIPEPIKPAKVLTISNAHWGQSDSRHRFQAYDKNQNDDKDDLTLFSIVIFAVESNSGVKWSLEMVPWGKKGDFEA